MSNTGLNLGDDGVRYIFLMEGDELVVHSPTIHHKNGLIDDGCEVMRVDRSDRRFPPLFEKYRLQQKMLNAHVREKLGWTVTLPDSSD